MTRALSVIKIGGSLMQSSKLPLWLKQLQKLSLQQHIVIVPGGGVYANLTRTLQQKLKYPDSTAHQLAILSMIQYGYLLKGLAPNLHTCSEIEQLTKNHATVWLPEPLLKQYANEIPHSWDYTSDSIALWLAIKLNAKHLIFVKSLQKKSDRLADLIKDKQLDSGVQSLINEFCGRLFWFNKDAYHLLDDQNWMDNPQLRLSP